MHHKILYQPGHDSQIVDGGKSQVVGVSDFKQMVQIIQRVVAAR
jgi:hypothetical protein